ncbi:VRR-NUC domain-containing protein [Nonomuraea dietziae]|uniref:VRR-NUC domain-containing protein n=1 Tax=Nonomuraea dietziae TaxID=65515 RepID=UPI0033CDBCF3
MNLLEAMNTRLNRMSAEAQTKLMKSMNEDDLRDAHIVPRARALGYLIYWTWKSIHSPKGFPDVVLVHPVTGAVIIRELKKYGNAKRYQPRPDQQAWLDAFGVAGLDAAVWTPADLFSGEIDRVLIAGAKAR